MKCSTSTSTSTSSLLSPLSTSSSFPLLPSSNGSNSSFFLHLPKFKRQPISLQAKATNSTPNNKKQQQQIEEEQVEEVEEELPWIQEKALDLVEFTGSVTQAIPGPRVAHTSLPWFLALPLAYFGLTFVISLVKTVQKFSSPRERRRKLVNKNATLNKLIDELFEQGRDAVHHSALEDITKKTGFGMEEVVRKYIRYVLNDKPFNGDTVADLIQLRKASLLTDSQVAEVLNEISRRIVKDKGPVVMDASGYTERGFKRKLAVQALFAKVFYLSELPDFCSKDNSLIVKEIFGVTDEDVDELRIQSLSNSGDMEALEKMIVTDSEDNVETQE